MSLDKTLTDQYRLPLKLDKYPVTPSLPEHFGTVYPKFVEFITAYYQQYDANNSPARFLNELQHNRDMADVTPQLLRLIGEELFLGKDYTESFTDKESAIQISNLLYRSKGTGFSIEQFFRIFFGFDIDIRYGRNEIFTVGDPDEEKLLYISEYRSGGTDASGNPISILFPADRLKFNFPDGLIEVYALALTPKREIVPSLYIRESETPSEDYIDNVGVVDYIVRTAVKTTYNVLYLLKEDVDYEIDYDSKSIVFLKPGIENSLLPGDPWLDHLAEFGELAPPSQELDFDGNPFGDLRYPKSLVDIVRRFPAGSPIGADIGDKRITDNAYYQMFSILIKTPIAVSAWEDVYKDFIHPSGMYLAGEVLLETVSSLGLSAKPTSIEKYDLDYEGVGVIADEAYSEVTELNVKPKPTRPTPSSFVFNMQDANISLVPQAWVGEENSTITVEFNRRLMPASDQWLVSATSGGLKHGLVFPAATPSTLVFRYIENTTLNLVDVDVQQDCLIGNTYKVSILVSATQIFTSSNGVNSLYNATVEYYPTVDAIGDDFTGAIWDVVLQDSLVRSNVLDYPLREGTGEIFYAYKDNGSPYTSRNLPVPEASLGTWGPSTISVWKGNNISVPEWSSSAASGFTIRTNLTINSLADAESLLMWDTNNSNVGLRITSDNKLAYAYAHIGGIETIEISILEVDIDHYVDIEHFFNKVVITSTLEGSEVRSVIISNIAPSELVKINFFTSSNIDATLWNVEFLEGVNTRYYPMQEGSGTDFLGYDQNGIATGSSEDASIIGSGDWILKNYLTLGGA